ncbi:hypothetical protein TD95_001608 [Thielaviopsis punctulata]|uniref:Uncharacterized protein n=1 Tax=Thielaviopsis punctulata TaxID=72032 RepID=A0A0F4ZEW9_9PEZI|nr:hypothetical protein TD95_001608 [Thielaviopsis punctulata]
MTVVEQEVDDNNSKS